MAIKPMYSAADISEIRVKLRSLAIDCANAGELSDALTMSCKVLDDLSKNITALENLIADIISELKKILPRKPSMDGRASWNHEQRIIERIINQFESDCTHEFAGQTVELPEFANESDLFGEVK